MAEEELELDVNKSNGNKTTTILLIVLIVLVLIIGGIGAWLYLAKGEDESASSDSGETVNKELAPLLYLTMVPEFVVNFGSDSKVRYLQVDLQIATRDQVALDTVNTYRPVLRNDILVLLSGLSFEELKERSGKESLQKKILNTINRVVNEAMHVTDENKKTDSENDKDKHTTASSIHEEVDGPIENVYFTSFIMQ